MTNRLVRFFSPATAVLLPLALVAGSAFGQLAAPMQQEGMIPTQMLIRADSKQDQIPNAQSLTLELDRKTAPISSLARVQANGSQIALLIDDGLTRDAGIQLGDIRHFIQALPAGTEILVGYMQNGRVVSKGFTTDLNAAANEIRLPNGIPGISASPYFCLSEFVKHWPGAEQEGSTVVGGKARFVMMLTNGVDPYNGSDSITNQDSPYVAAAVTDANRAGVAVSSIYYRDAGFRGGRASFSGQSYLQQVADGTGGESYYEGLISPVSLAPFLTQFTRAVAETYIATFPADAQAGGHDHLVRVKLNSSVAKLKVRHPDEVRPGNRELAQGSQGARLAPEQP